MKGNKNEIMKGMQEEARKPFLQPFPHHHQKLKKAHTQPRSTHNLSFDPLPNFLTFSQTTLSLYSYVSLALSLLHTQFRESDDVCVPILSEDDDDGDGDGCVPKTHTRPWENDEDYLIIRLRADPQRRG